MLMPGFRKDPTREGPAGSRTETKITEESELGSDNAGGERESRTPPDQAVPPEPPR
jgi:hypothetical protein